MKTSEMPVLELSGNPRERGYHYGSTMRDSINEVVIGWRHHLGNFLNSDKDNPSLDTDTYLQSFFAETQYLQAIENWAPDLLEEVKGLAEGANQPEDNILGMQLMDEEWIFGLCRALERPITKCTAFGIPGQGRAVSYAGQNMDIGSWIEGKQILLRLKGAATTPEALIFSIAGEIGLNGLNASGVGVTCNTLPQLSFATDGLPVAFIVRKILQQNSIDEAEVFLRNIKHASGQNYILSAANDIRCFECSGNTVIRYQPEEYHGRVFHSNHPLVNKDTINLLPPEKMLSNNTLARFKSISDRLGTHSNSPSLIDIKAALSAHDDVENPVSRNTNQGGSAIGYTAGSAIYEFSDKVRLHLASGPPCETEFLTFEFSK